jgi:hypothetical protein
MGFIHKTPLRLFLSIWIELQTIYYTKNSSILLFLLRNRLLIILVVSAYVFVYAIGNK